MKAKIKHKNSWNSVTIGGKSVEVCGQYHDGSMLRLEIIPPGAIIGIGGETLIFVRLPKYG